MFNVKWRDPFTVKNLNHDPWLVLSRYTNKISHKKTQQKVSTHTRHTPHTRDTSHDTRPLEQVSFTRLSALATGTVDSLHARGVNPLP